MAGAAIIEPDPDLHNVMGDLYALSAAMRLFYDDTHKTRCPSPGELAHYLSKPLPDGWPSGYRTDVVGGDWWVGRKVPEFSNARKFLREKAPSLDLYGRESQSTWLGEAFVWMSALSFGGKARPESEQKTAFKVAQGEGNDRQYLFFNSPGTDYYWRSSLIYTTEARAEALKKFRTDAKGPFVVPTTQSARQKFMASPVELPPDFNLGAEEDDGSARFGDVIINPIPRQREQ